MITNQPVAICPPVLQELLQGAYDQPRMNRVDEIASNSAMLDSPVPLARFEFAGEIYRVIRAASFTIRSSNDCLIAAIAMHHDVMLLHGDRDFDYIARFFPLRARNVIPSASRS
ncbi:MAG TPA: PIN domain-containing protein [Thermoanaerobaculia bacterium]|nr:PIN domain-containing protein [Thermoanaerobaculia bacterium]